MEIQILRNIYPYEETALLLRKIQILKSSKPTKFAFLYINSTWYDLKKQSRNFKKTLKSLF